MKLLKMAGLSVLLVSTSAIVADAQNQASLPYANPPQAATNPGLPYSYAREPGPKAGPSGWIPPTTSSDPSVGIPSNPPQAGASASSGIRNERGSYYSKQGFGPAPN